MQCFYEPAQAHHRVSQATWLPTATASFPLAALRRSFTCSRIPGPSLVATGRNPRLRRTACCPKTPDR
jgi:hypothetical protein